MDLQLSSPTAESMASSVYRQLKRNLMVGALKPGDSLTLKSLTDNLGISQTPVREALLRLVSERLLRLIHGRSATVPILTPETFSELREIRIHLETFATERACPNLADADIESVKAIHRQYMRCRREGDYAGILLANIEFHFTIYRASHMPNLLAMIENLWAQTGPYAGFMYKTSPTVHEDGHPHDHIIAALKRRDAKAAVEKIRLDVQRHGNRMMEFLKQAGHFEKNASPRPGSPRSPGRSQAAAGRRVPRPSG